MTGRTVPAPREKEESLSAGKGVRASPQADGRVQFFADADGELFFGDNLLEVKQVHVIAGDIGLEWGNVKFSGAVEIRGRVLDQQGAVLPGVTVTVRNQDTGMFRETVSNADGATLPASFTVAPTLLPSALA